jgi:hypothetical protein
LPNHAIKILILTHKETTMFNQLKTTINRSLLKYSAGMHITCPHCDNIADYRRWVILDRADGSTVWSGCDKCFEKLSEYLTIPDGWTVTRESAPKAPHGAAAGRTLKQQMAAYRKNRQAWLKRPVSRKFPKINGAWSTENYVDEYLRINKLRFVGCRTLAETRTAYHLNDEPHYQAIALFPEHEEVTE